MKLYKTALFGKLIEEVEAERVSEKSVWLKNGRSARYSKYANYWDSLDEAKAFLKEGIERTIKSAESRISKTKNQLNELENY